MVEKPTQSREGVKGQLLGGASEDAQSYWQGRFAACTLLTFPFELI